MASYDILLRREEPQLPRLAELGLFVGALAIQVLVPYYIPVTRLFDLTLLALVYVALHRRSEMAGMFSGAAIGLAQDALSHDPVGLFGMIKTIVGFVCGWISQFVEIDFPGARSTLVGFFYVTQQIALWTLQTVLLGKHVEFSLPGALVLGALHAVLAWFLFALLDRVRIRP